MPNIRLYATPSCVYCKMAKKFLEDHRFAYQEFNVAEDERAREEMIEKSHQLGVPVIDIDGEIFVGFDRRGLSHALKI